MILRSYALAGSHRRMWYDEARDLAARRYGQDRDLYLRLFAVCSLNCDLRSNGTFARRALTQLQTRRPISGFMGSVITAIYHAEHGIIIGGPKIRAFAENLAGNPYPVTLDRWIARAAGVYDPQHMDDADRASAILQVRRLAHELRWTPAETQAAIWAGIRLAHGITDPHLKEIV